MCQLRCSHLEQTHRPRNRQDANMSSPPQSSPEDAGDSTTAPKETTYTDPSGPIFSMYITRALKFDTENVENWKGGADGILIFVRFSAALTMTTAVYSPILTIPRLVFSLLRWHL